MREDLQITNRLLYQLSYVGLVQCLRGFQRFRRGRAARHLHVNFFANARSSLRMAAAPCDFEGFQCEKCQSFHIRVDEVKFEAKRQAALAARESRRTYAERRAAQWNPETQSYDE